MERYLDQELAELKAGLLKIGGMVERAIFQSIEALKGLNLRLF